MEGDLTLEAMQDLFDAMDIASARITPTWMLVTNRVKSRIDRKLKRKRHRDKYIRRDPNYGFVITNKWWEGINVR